jgi:hypothetical protein
MVEAMQRGRRRRVNDRMLLAASQYAAMGWPVCPGVQLRASQNRERPVRERQLAGSGRACSCDRVGCPAPGAHPLSPAWKRQASADLAIVGRWWSQRPDATILLVTGRIFDVLDVPLAAGLDAMRRLEAANTACGPVAVSAGDRALFFVTSRAAVADDDEWWSCHLDCEPEVLPEVNGLRWHCRDSFVVAPPSRLTNGMTARWLAEPGTKPLPDSLRLLEVLADACEEIAG